MKNHTVLMLVFAGLVFGCAKKEEAPVSIPPTPAQFALAKAADARGYILTMGTIASCHSVSVVPQVSGQIVSVNFKQGRQVKKGDVLAVIDKRPFAADLKMSQGALRQARAQLKIDQLSVLRNQKLAKDGYVDKQTFDSLLAKVDVDKGVVESAQAAVETAAIKLDWCDIKAPESGKVGLYNINAGNYVSAGSSIITTIQDVDNLFVDFIVPSQNLHDVLEFMKANGGKMEVEVSYIEDDMSNKKRNAQVDIVLNKIRYQTGTAVLRGKLDNADHLFWPNQPIRVKVSLDKLKDAVLIPDMCIQLNAAGPFVYVATPVKDGVYTVKMVQIEKGQLFGDKRAVSGLKDGDKVVLRVSQLRLQAGPFVYEATEEGAIIGADGKPIMDQKAMVAFMANAAKIADSLRAEMAKKKAEAAAKKRDMAAEARNAAKEAATPKSEGSAK